MAPKFRVAKLLVPRFGVGWVFVAMLLLISGAGWWKFHRDLYVEERAVVEALKSTGQRVAFHHRDYRVFGGSLEEEPTDVPWNAPLLDPIRMIFVQGTPSREARDAALRLPQLTAYCQSAVPASSTDDGWQGIETFLALPLPVLPETALDSARLEAPLADGETLSASEAHRIAESIRAAWQNPDAVPPSRLVVSETTYESTFLAGWPMQKPAIRVDAIDRERGFRYGDHARYVEGEIGTLLLNDRIFWFIRQEDGSWSRSSRRIHVDEPLESTLDRRFPDDDFPYVAGDFLGDGIVGRWMAKFSPALKVRRVAQIDDVRYRVDFAPFDVPVDPERDIGSQGRPRIEEWNLVLRSDMDWAPEESRMVQNKIPISPPQRFERRMSQRLVRVGEYVSVSERVAKEYRLAAAPHGF